MLRLLAGKGQRVAQKCFLYRQVTWLWTSELHVALSTSNSDPWAQSLKEPLNTVRVGPYPAERGAGFRKDYSCRDYRAGTGLEMYLLIHLKALRKAPLSLCYSDESLLHLPPHHTIQSNSTSWDSPKSPRASFFTLCPFPGLAGLFLE